MKRLADLSSSERKTASARKQIEYLHQGAYLACPPPLSSFSSSKAKGEEGALPCTLFLEDCWFILLTGEEGLGVEVRYTNFRCTHSTVKQILPLNIMTPV